MSETKTCPRCGAPIRPDETPAGLCAACLMKMGFDSRSGAAEVVLTGNEDVERPPAPTIAELAPHFPELEIVELVGRGGMGAVYRARQRSLERDVALKILTVGSGDATFADRFQREARTLASLSHPGITAVFDFGQRGPWSFLAMEFVEGASLRQMLRARELGSRESLAIVSQMCDALQYAHDKGVVHRDIKPENVLVTRDGRVKVLDFGLAKLVGTAQRDNLTLAKQVMGTPHYMAPEQWEKPLTVDHRADIYAMGVVFYELLTGELPIGRFAPPSHKVAVDVRLDDVVLRSLEKEPARRYQHASQVKDDVTGITSTPNGVPPPLPAHAEAQRKSGRKWLIVAASVGCLMLLAVPAALMAIFVFAAPAAVHLGNSASPIEDRVSQPVEEGERERMRTASDDFGLANVRESLVLEPELADRLGIDPARASKLRSAFNRVWSRYLNLEAGQVSAAWLDPNTLDVLVRPAGVAHFGLKSDAREAIDQAFDHAMRATAGEAALRSFVDQQLRFGAESEHFELSISGDVARVKFREVSSGPAGEVTVVETPPSSAMRRVWDRMLATRPEPPK